MFSIIECGDLPRRVNKATAAIIISSTFIIFSSARAQVMIPVVACTESSGSTTAAPPNKQIEVNLTKTAATQLAMFVFYGGALLGPRDWQCQTSLGWGVYVMIAPPGSNGYPYGIGMMDIDEGDGYRMERELDSWALTYFSKKGKQIEETDGFPYNAIRKYSTDKIKYVNSRMLVYTTPENHNGVGSDLLIGLGYGKIVPGEYFPYSTLPSSQPINGFMKITALGSGVPDEFIAFAVSLPKELSGLYPYILNHAESSGR